MGAATDAAEKAQADRSGKIKAMDVAKNEVWVKSDDPLPKATPKAKPARKPVRTQKEREANPDSGHHEPIVRPTKAEAILAMLKRPEGATSKQIEDATGWQPHSVRGFLGTLRKNGTEVTSTKEPKQPTIYRIAYVDVV